MLPAGSKRRNVVCISAACCGLNMAVVAAAAFTRNKSQVDLQAWMVEAGIKYSIKVVYEGPLQGGLPAFIAHSVCLGPGLFRSSVQCAPSQLLFYMVGPLDGSIVSINDACRTAVRNGKQQPPGVVVNAELYLGLLPAL